VYKFGTAKGSGLGPMALYPTGNTMKTKPLWVGIDVGSEELVVATQRGEDPIQNGTFPNTPEGHKTLVRWLKPLRDVRVVVEATGNWHLDLAHFLQGTKNLEVMVANPRVVRRFAEAKNQRAKTDQVDAVVLLKFVQLMPFQKWTCPPELHWQFRSITRYLSSLVAEQTRLKNQLFAMESTTVTSVFVKELVETHLKTIKELIESCEVEALRVCRSDTTLERWLTSLCTLPGIGERSGVQLLGELAFLDAEMTPDQVVAYAGLDPRPRQSGKRDAPRHISRVGNRRLRGLLYMPALVSIRHNVPLGEWYRKLKENGKPVFVAQVALMRRLLRIAWVVMIRQGSWNPELALPPEQRKRPQAENAEISASVA
jgi:transposase